MTIRAKVLVGLVTLALAGGGILFAQERKQQALLEGVRGSLAVGDSKEKVERVLREQGLQPTITHEGRGYSVQIWFHFRPDVSVLVVLDGHWEVALISIKDHVD